MVRLGLVVPFYNEEGTAYRVVKELVMRLREAGLDFQVAAVGDGSIDGTPAVLRQLSTEFHEVSYVSDPVARGYGHAIRRGFALLDADVLGWIDGDGQVPPSCVVELLQAMERENAAVAFGRRRDREDGWRRRWASLGYNFLLRLATGVRIPDINAKPKLFRREIMTAIRLVADDWFIDTELVVGAAVRGAKIVRVPVPFLARGHGASKVKGSVVGEYVRNLRRMRTTWRQGRALRGATATAGHAQVR